MSTISHPFEPLYDENSKILILGSFPSVISRKNNFYYANKNNRFWKVISNIFNSPFPENIIEKKKLLFDNQIALWDVIASCEINKSYDSSIRNVIPNDLAKIVAESKIVKIGCNGDKAFQLYNKYILDKTNIKAIKLPSTSSANASYRIDTLTRIYGGFIKGENE